MHGVRFFHLFLAVVPAWPGLVWQDRFDSLSPSWHPLTLSGNAASSLVAGNKLTLTADPASEAGLWNDRALAGHFEVEVGIDRDAHAELALFSKGTDGKPDLSNYTSLHIDSAGGLVVVSAHDRQNGVADVLDNAGLANKARYSVPLRGYQGQDSLDSYSVPYRWTAGRIKILHHAGEGFFHLYWSVRDIAGFNAPGANNPGWMELAPSREWSQLSGQYFVGLLSKGGLVRYDSLTVSSWPLAERAGNLFQASRRDYIWSGYHGDAAVVQFDSALGGFAAGRKFVFAAQNNYVPVWDLNDSLAFTYEFVEQWGGGSNGCLEPMSDRNLRFSNVQILEDGAVRKVVEWDYANIDPDYRPADFGLGTDISHVRETYTVYPDGTVLRKIRFYPKLDTQYRKWNELLEYIVIAGRNTAPSDHTANPSLSIWPYSTTRTDYSPTGQYSSNKVELTGTGEISLITHFRDAPDAFSSWADHPWNATNPGASVPLSVTISWHDIGWDFTHWPINKEQYSEWFGSSPSTRKTWPQIPRHASLMNAESYESTWAADYQLDNGKKYREWVSLLGLSDPANPGAIEERTYSWLYPYRVDSAQGCQAQAYDAGQMVQNLSETAGSSICSAVLVPETAGDKMTHPVFRIAGWKAQGASVEIGGQLLSESEYRAQTTGDTLLLWIGREFLQSAHLRILAPSPTRIRPAVESPAWSVLPGPSRGSLVVRTSGFQGQTPTLRARTANGTDIPLIQDRLDPDRILVRMERPLPGLCFLSLGGRSVPWVLMNP